MADINAIAVQFTDFYYSTFDANRANLQSLYVRLRLLRLRAFYCPRSNGSMLSALARRVYAVVGGFSDCGCREHH